MNYAKSLPRSPAERLTEPEHVWGLTTLYEG